MSSELSKKGMNEILDLVYAGRKVAACKRYIELRREEFDQRTSLLEAKQFVEKLTSELKNAEPERFAGQSGPGCSTVLLLLLVLFLRAAWEVI